KTVPVSNHGPASSPVTGIERCTPFAARAAPSSSWAPRIIRPLWRPAASPAPWVRPSWRHEIAKARAELLRQEQDVLAAADSPVNPYRLALSLAEAVDDDAIITLDIGSFTHWFDLGFRTREHTILISPTWRAVGSWLPAAIAARLAYPERQVVALVGDGGFMASLGELATAVHYQLPIAVIVIRNDGYDIEAQKMQRQGFTTLGTRPARIDFVAFARACGAQARTVSSARHLSAALRD